MKIVLDTNILVGALLGSKPCNRVIAKCLCRRFAPLVGAALLAEYEDVVNRDDVFAKSRLTRAERNEVLDSLLSVSAWTRVYYLWRPNLRDEADNHVLELAVAGGADYLVTRNVADFKQAQLLFPAVKLCSPEELLALLKE